MHGDKKIQAEIKFEIDLLHFWLICVLVEVIILIYRIHHYSYIIITTKMNHHCHSNACVILPPTL